MLSDFGVPMLLWLHNKVDAFACFLWRCIDELDLHDQAHL